MEPSNTPAATDDATTSVMIDSRHCTLAVLAGGQSTRMGRNKAEITIGGRLILEHLLAEVAWPGPTLLVTAPGREHPPGWQRFDREVQDPVAGVGPLRGVMTALESANTDTVVVITVDMPNVRAHHLQSLLGILMARSKIAGVMRSRVMDGREQVEPFPSAYRVAMAKPLVADRLASGARSVYGLSEAEAVVIAPTFDDWSDDVWLNLNRPEDVGEV
jgi:molybdopterin-guanine dinucleotide biosynthesis protein A